MPRIAQPRTIRPSGIEQSANGKYFYWNCTISGLETFAPEPRFNEIVKNYGGEDVLFKTYVLRSVKKYVEAGFDSEVIKDIIKTNDGKLPDLDAGSKARKAELPKKTRKKGLKQYSTSEVVSEIELGVESRTKVYPWSGNPDYFKSPAVPLVVSDITKEVCLYPNRYLSDDCYGCPVYDNCALSCKFKEEDWKKPRKRNEVKITQFKSFDS